MKFLREGRVELGGPQSGFNMNEGCLSVKCGNRGCICRGCVSLRDDTVRLFAFENAIQSAEKSTCGLRGAKGGPTVPDCYVGYESEFGQCQIKQVALLTTGYDPDVGPSCAAQAPDNRRQLDDLRPGADDDEKGSNRNRTRELVPMREMHVRSPKIDSPVRSTRRTRPNYLSVFRGTSLNGARPSDK